MYFDPTPKERLEDFFNYREELRRLLEAVKRGEKIILVKGIRRVGKTSLMKVASNLLSGHVQVWVDGRLEGEKLKMLPSLILREIDPLERIKAELSTINIYGVEVKVRMEKEIKRVDQKLEKAEKRAVVWVDEGEEIRRLGKILSYYYDWSSRITFVVSGSVVGLLEGMFSADAPLYGRVREEITMNPLKREASLEFLRRGFAQEGKDVREGELLEAVEELDGLVGWLTFYGYLRRFHTHEKALRIVKEEGKKIVEAELKHFLRKTKASTKRILTILRILKEGKKRWDEIYESLILLSREKVSKSRVSEYLEKLIEHGFIVKEGAEYKLADPLLKTLF